MSQSQDWQFEKLSDFRAELGESPEIIGNDIWWVDIEGKTLCRTGRDGATETWIMPELVGFVAPAPDTGLIIGMETGLFRFSPETGPVLLHALTDTGLRYNDATCDALGRVWCGTMDITNYQPVGTLYRLDPDMSLTEVSTGFMTINGLAADLDAGRLYLSDSNPAVQKAWTLPMDATTQTERVPLIDFEPLTGRPDGGALDAEGNYWIAGVSGGVLHCFATDGTHLAEVPTPMPDPTKLIFDGSGGGYLTSKTDTPGTTGGWLSRVSRSA